MGIVKNIDHIDILNTIYRELFKRLQRKMIDVFLCGGISTKEQISMRDKLKEELERTNKIRVLYPEELFVDILSSSKKHNLLFLEQLLADNCDRICIVCESVGSFVELGAFTNNESTSKKVIAMVQTKYKNQSSFLMLGPIKQIQAFSKDNVIFYNTNASTAAENLISQLSKTTKHNIKKDINSIVGLHYYMLLMLYFYKKVELSNAIDYLKILIANNGFNVDDQAFSLLFRPAVKLLYKERLIEQYSDDINKYYRITEKGIILCEQLLSSFFLYDKSRICDKIRMQILYKAYY